MNKKEIIEAIASKTDTPKAQVETFLNTFVEVLVADVKKGNKVAIPGLGGFEARQSKARDGINPSTGEKIRIAAKKAPKFKAAKGFKDILN